MKTRAAKGNPTSRCVFLALFLGINVCWADLSCGAVAHDWFAGPHHWGGGGCCGCGCCAEGGVRWLLGNVGCGLRIVGDRRIVGHYVTGVVVVVGAGVGTVVFGT